MPKTRMRPPSDDKEKIKLLKQDIKDMKLDMKETFSVMEEMPKPKRKRRFPRSLIIAAGAVIIIGAAAYIFITLLTVQA